MTQYSNCRIVHALGMSWVRTWMIFLLSICDFENVTYKWYFLFRAEKLTKQAPTTIKGSRLDRCFLHPDQKSPSANKAFAAARLFLKRTCSDILAGKLSCLQQHQQLESFITVAFLHFFFCSHYDRHILLYSNCYYTSLVLTLSYRLEFVILWKIIQKFLTWV